MSDTKVVNPVVNQINHEASKLTEVKVTIEESKESAAILYKTTEQAISLAFGLQDSYDNASQFQRDALQDASVMFLKAQCQRAIGQWDNLVTKMTKLQKYQSMTRTQVEDALKIHPKCAPFYKTALKAVDIRKNLR